MKGSSPPPACWNIRSHSCIVAPVTDAGRAAGSMLRLASSLPTCSSANLPPWPSEYICLDNMVALSRILHWSGIDNAARAAEGSGSGLNGS